MSDHREVELEVNETKEQWNEYKLVDGTVFRVKVLLVSIARVEGQYNEEGDPVYNAKFTLVPDVKVPKELKKQDRQ